MGGWAEMELPIRPCSPSAHQSSYRSIQSPGQATGFLTGLIELTPCRGLDQFEILHEMEDVGEFGKRPHSDVKVAAKFSRSLLRRSLRDIRSEEHTSELQSLAYLVCR